LALKIIVSKFRWKRNKKICLGFQIQNQNISFLPRGAWKILSKSALFAPQFCGAGSEQPRRELKISRNNEWQGW